jgi:hypothetical protein
MAPVPKNRVRVENIFLNGFNVIRAFQPLQEIKHISFYQNLWLYAAIPPR